MVVVLVYTINVRNDGSAAFNKYSPRNSGKNFMLTALGAKTEAPARIRTEERFNILAMIHQDLSLFSII